MSAAAILVSPFVGDHMQIKLHIFKAGGRLDAFESSVRAASEEAIEKIKERLILPDVDVVVVDNPSAAIPETGVAGFAPTAHVIFISVDPHFPNLRKKIGEEIKHTLAHELHHCARWQGVGYGKTLLEALVSEGLADHFDIEINGGPPRPWSVALSGDALEKMKERAEKEFGSERYNHSAWFSGSENEGVARWAGYALGYYLVQEHVRRTGKTAADLVGERADSFVQ